MVLDFIEILKVIFLGIVEGITEWLPISSTGHMILVDEFITLNMSEAFKEMFFVVIQLGAILAVVVMFWNKMFPFQFKNKAQSIVKKDTFSLWFKVAVACVPSAIMGILFDDYLDAYLQTPIVISIMLIFYGLLFILIENWNKKRTPTTMALSDISYKTDEDGKLTNENISASSHKFNLIGPSSAIYSILNKYLGVDWDQLSKFVNIRSDIALAPTMQMQEEGTEYVVNGDVTLFPQIPENILK